MIGRSVLHLLGSRFATSLMIRARDPSDRAGFTAEGGCVTSLARRRRGE